MGKKILPVAESYLIDEEYGKKIFFFVVESYLIEDAGRKEERGTGANGT